MFLPHHLPSENKAILEVPEPEPEGLGEFVGTIVDKDSEASPSVFDEMENVEER